MKGLIEEWMERGVDGRINGWRNGWKDTSIDGLADR